MQNKEHGQLPLSATHCMYVCAYVCLGYTAWQQMPPQNPTPIIPAPSVRSTHQNPVAAFITHYISIARKPLSQCGDDPIPVSTPFQTEGYKAL